jgi:Flp pilus assembly protein CpaB
MTYRMRNILIAVALAGFAALLVTFYVSNYKKSVQHQQAQTTVLVASGDILQGTLGSDVVSGGKLRTEQVTRAAVVPGAISSADQIKNLVAIAPVYAGEQVTTRRFGPLQQQGIKGQLTGTYRAVQLAGNSNQVLSGTLEPNDTVDFEAVVTVHFAGNGSSGISGSDVTFSRIVVRNLKVLQVQNGSSSGHIGGNGQSSVLLRMTDSQSQKIAAAYAKGDYWTLELRPGLKSADSPTSLETAATLAFDGISRSVLNAIFRIAEGK